MDSAAANRMRLLGASAGISLLATWLFIQFSTPGGFNAVDGLRVVLVAVSAFWLSWGALLGVAGLFYRPQGTGHMPLSPPLGRCAVVVPIYNEDPVATFSRIAAMSAGLSRLGLHKQFDFVVLSDTTSLDVAREEVVWFDRLAQEAKAKGHFFYRRRENNTGRKSGNIEDFIKRSGAAYAYAVILDADSLMSAETLVLLARRMDADPRLGLLQTVPKIIGARTFFGRAIQFSASYYSSIFARGIALVQGEQGPFWGHNAIVRMAAFAGNCGLPRLSGKPPFGGLILSHDYVEAALLARAGWKVQVDPEIGGSFEEGPENIIEYAKRDRRWCQGNLQHGRLLGAPGLHWWNRFTFLQGIMAYLGSPVWLGFLGASIISEAMPRTSYITFSQQLASSIAAWCLVGLITSLLVMPKLLIIAWGAVTGENEKFGGTRAVFFSAITEIVFSSLIAPITLLMQTRSVFQVLFGIDGGWPATSRDERSLSLKQAWEASSWIVMTGALVLATAMALAPYLIVWLLPVIIPMGLSPFLIAYSSMVSDGRDGLLLMTAEEYSVAPAIDARDHVRNTWRNAYLEQGARS